MTNVPEQQKVEFKQLTAEELHLKEQVYNKLLSVMDLSLIETISKEQAQQQIVDVVRRLEDAGEVVVGGGDQTEEFVE